MKQNIKYVITLKGLLYSEASSEKEAERIYQAILAYCYTSKTNAIVIRDGGVFVEMALK